MIEGLEMINIDDIIETFARMLMTQLFFFFQAEDGIRDLTVTGVQTCALPILMLWLAVLPSRADRGAPAARATAADLRFRAGLLGVAAALVIAIPTVLIGVYLRRMYSAGLFLGTPFTIGYISAYVFNARGAQSERQTMQVALLAMALAGGAMLVFALEGAVCIAMAFPIAALLALPGAILGRAVALRSVGDRKSVV